MMIPGQKTLDKEAAILLINMIMAKTHPISKRFIAFLMQSERKVLNKDQWLNIIPLFTLLEKGEKYDSSGACKSLGNTQIGPSLYDEFNEWMLEN